MSASVIASQRMRARRRHRGPTRCPGSAPASAVPARLRSWPMARRRPARMLSRAGISSSAASRENVASIDASLGSDPSSLPSMEARACLSRELRPTDLHLHRLTAQHASQWSQRPPRPRCRRIHSASRDPVLRSDDGAPTPMRGVVGQPSGRRRRRTQRRRRSRPFGRPTCRPAAARFPRRRSRALAPWARPRYRQRNLRTRTTARTWSSRIRRSLPVPGPRCSAAGAACATVAALTFSETP